MADIGSIIVGVLVGAAGNYAAAEVYGLRKKLAERLQGDSAWEDFAADPANGMAQQRLVATINRVAGTDQGFARSLSAWTGTGSGTTATSGGIAFGGNVGDHATVVSHSKRVHIGNRTYPLGGVIGGVLIALAVFAGLIYGGYRAVGGVMADVTGGSLSAGSTCQEFMESAPEVRDQAVRSIATEMGKKLRTFDRLNVESTCGEVPAQTLGDAIDRTMPDA
ncbi:hypothetical protein [Winogradskya humida]|uniref:Uncharacterized protein n=1 Tax=Winogradskya humida TaxID=113566 RepID=A0ABQ4A1X8_9ACTN|nr:hypothetical protein [Actinoplanes humidus]GIE24714.1 hypothetical protein Ahu01nite_078160 [Actinoplanes humidus]